MRHVFGSHSEVAHVWANDWEATGHGSGKNVYFEGPTIYSHGRHFPIASHVTVDGEHVVLFTRRGYSVSTAKHKSIVWRAAHHLRIIEVNDPSSRDWRGLMRESLQEAARLVASAKRRRVDYMREVDRDGAAKALEAARLFARWANVKLPEADEAAIAEATAIEARERARIARELRERRKAEEKRKAALEALWDRAKHYWRIGMEYPEELQAEARALGIYSFSNAYGLSIALRRRGDEIETSWGARFPVEHGIRAFRVLKGLWERGKEWSRDRGVGPRLGHYTIDRVTADAVVAGCHTVSRAEVEHMAAELEVAEIAPVALKELTNA